MLMRKILGLWIEDKMKAQTIKDQEREINSIVKQRLDMSLLKKMILEEAILKHSNA